MNFLEKWQRTHAGLSKSANSFINAKDKEVIIIGGGDTGVDCIATSLRQVWSNTVYIRKVSEQNKINPFFLQNLLCFILR